MQMMNQHAVTRIANRFTSALDQPWRLAATIRPSASSTHRSRKVEGDPDSGALGLRSENGKAPP